MSSEKLQTGDPQKSEAMSAAALKASKKQLRSLMKLRLSTISKESLESQSPFHAPCILDIFSD